MAFTVAVEVDHLPSACLSPTLHTVKQLQTLLIPNLNPRASVKSSLKKFIRENLAIADDLQSISAPLFSLLREQDRVEDIYSRYCCHAEAENSDLHVDEESFAFFGRERGQLVELCDDDRLDQRHIIDECKLHFKRLPQKLPQQGGRIFVEMKNGILPLLGISPCTAVSHIKKTLETMLGIPVSQQLLLSVGRVMHDDFFVQEFAGLHAIYEDSVLDLCKSGDTNAEQAHRRMVVQISISGGESEFTLVVQGRDTIRSVMQMVESRTGYAQWQQRVTLSGKALDERKTMSDYFIYPDCTLEISVFKNLSKAVPRISDNDLQNQTELALDMDTKPMARKLKLVRTMKGMVMGTLTIPVLTADTIFDVRRKIKRSLQPLLERNLSMHTPIKEPRHIDITPKSSPAPIKEPRHIDITPRSSPASIREVRHIDIPPKSSPAPIKEPRHIDITPRSSPAPIREVKHIDITTTSSPAPIKEPLVEHNLSMHIPIKEPRHIDITPKSSPASTKEPRHIEYTPRSSPVSRSAGMKPSRSLKFWPENLS